MGTISCVEACRPDGRRRCAAGSATRVLVLRARGDAVALGHDLGRLQHGPCRSPASSPSGAGSWARSVLLAWFCTSEIDSTPPATDVHAVAGDDLLRGGGDGHQARGAEAVDGHARGGDRAAGRAARSGGRCCRPWRPAGVAQPTTTSSTSAGSMPARWMALRPRGRPWRRLGVVERARKAFAEARAGGGYDDGFTHGSLLTVS
jgi:hypothetical protein